ncbi:MAG: carboxylating nicotinate-nucleotide diphosphorylase [Ignavibacteria bacterium]|nr:carboxylating nicotinate-nucleotide diphosphorylase [Ignavibacteria bacterium]
MNNSISKLKLDINSVKELVKVALKEDMNTGDLTTDNLISDNINVTANLEVKANGIIAGLSVAEVVLKLLDPEIIWEPLMDDGDKVESGKIIANFNGSYKAILTGERTVLNFLQRISGIATQTNKYVNALKGLKTIILDTRKTVPGHRILDKYAVKMGGGTNHRFGLFDLVMIKDNHIKIAGGISNAVLEIKAKVESTIKIEVETSILEEVEEAIKTDVDIIMLDNMSIDQMRKAVKLIDGKVLTEASGNITLESVRKIAETGVDFISVGELTHSVKALDIGLYILDN